MTSPAAPTTPAPAPAPAAPRPQSLGDLGERAGLLMASAASERRGMSAQMARAQPPTRQQWETRDRRGRSRTRSRGPGARSGSRPRSANSPRWLGEPPCTGRRGPCACWFCRFGGGPGGLGGVGGPGQGVGYQQGGPSRVATHQGGQGARQGDMGWGYGGGQEWGASRQLCWYYWRTGGGGDGGSAPSGEGAITGTSSSRGKS